MSTDIFNAENMTVTNYLLHNQLEQIVHDLKQISFTKSIYIFKQSHKTISRTY